MLYDVQGKVKEGERIAKKELFSKIFAKIENVVSQSSGGVVRAAGCFYDPEIVFPND